MGRPGRLAAAAAGAALVAGTLTAAMPPPAYTGKIWSPFPLPAAKSVPGAPLRHGRAAAPRPAEPGAEPTARFAPGGARWPAAGTGVAALATSVPAWHGRLRGRLLVPARGWQPAGALPVSAEAATGTLTGVQVRVASRMATARLGIRGVVLSVSSAGGSGSARVRLSYAGFGGMFGGAWSSRMRLVELPACALTDPALAACGRTVPVASVNDATTRTVTAMVALSAPAAADGAAARGPAGAGAPGGGGLVLAALAGPSGPGGDFTATPLRQSGTWAEQQGAFTYSYPLDVPPSLAGQAPQVTLGYNSQAIDSETSGANTQGGWIGDGWDYFPGFIERSYKPCQQDGIANSGDLCWGGSNATLSLGAHSSQLVLDDAGGWHLQSDDGTKVQLLQNGANGLWNGEYWLVTTTDGTKYYFGLDHLPGGNNSDSSTNAAWGEPIYNPNSGDPCHSSSQGQNSECQMGWRWNLDFVVDPMNRLTVYDYAAETNYYNRGYGQGNGHGTLTQYVRGGYLTTISYGSVLADAIDGAKPAAQVLFGSSDRCLSAESTCDANHNATYWPDVPWDQNCGSTGSCTNYTPTYWSTQRLTSVTTQVLESGTYQSIDSWTLAQAFPVGAGSNPVIALTSIAHTGLDGGSASLPALSFTNTEFDNRVDGLVPAAPPVDRPRITTVNTEAGASISVVYDGPACSRVNKIMPANAWTNTMPCFPVYWTPPGQGQIQDWFIKSLIAQVNVSDQTGAASPTEVNNYTYLGDIGWHYNDNPLVKSGQRTWDQYRGYQQIKTTTGVAPDPVTQTIQTYMQGMDGDNNGTGGTRSIKVYDPAGDPGVTDSNWLNGQVIETDTYTAAGGRVVRRDVAGPWIYTQTADQPQSGLPDLTAHMPASSQDRVMSLFADGNWRANQTNTYLNSSALVVAVDRAPFGSAETCTSISYADAPPGNSMMESYPAQVTTVTGGYAGGNCPTATAQNIVADARTYYDDPSSTLSSMGALGSLASPGGLVTGTQQAVSWTSQENWRAKSATSYDALGRVIAQTTPAPAGATGTATTTTAYSPAYSAGKTTELPTKITTTNPSPFSWTTVTTLDQGRELPLRVTDVNGEVTTAAYDPLGRVTSVTKPLDQASGDKSVKFAYSETGTAPSAVTTSTLREDGSYSTDVKIYDGMLQLRQEQSTPANAAAGRVITDTFYESHGWVVKSRDPYYDASTAPGTSMFLAGDGSIPGWTGMTYDGMGRLTASGFYSGSNLQWQTTTAYPGLNETEITPAHGDTATSTFTNVLGQVTASWRYTVATPDGNPAHADVTSYTNTAAGQTASVSDNAGNQWTYSYDLAGEKISATDPGATAASTWTYDNAGNVATSTDARGQQLSYAYDLLGRKIAEYSGALNTGTLLASWAYDTAPLNGGPAKALGYLASATSYDTAGGASGGPYTESISGYTTAYSPAGTSTSVPASDLVPGATGTDTFTTSNTYSPLTGLLYNTRYSADQGLPAETVNYSYNLQGQLSASGGATAYLDSVIYDAFGKIQRTTYGLYGKQLVQTYTRDPGTQWLTQATTNLQTLTSAADSYSFTYNQAGSLTSSTDVQNAGGTQQQCYTYDNLGELSVAWTDTKGTTTLPSPSVTGIGGCVTTAPSAATIGGPAPYWQSYTYDLLGDRSSATFHDTSGNTANDITQTLTYPGNATIPATQPDAPATVTTQRGGTGGASTTLTAAYDPAGNTTGRAVTATSGSNPPAGPPAETSISYDAIGLTAKVTVGGGTSGYTYDASGNLLLQTSPAGNTLYLDGGAEQITYSTAAADVTAQRFYTGPDGVTIVRSYDSQAKTTTITDEAATLQGTVTEAIDATSQAITRRYFDPYGNPVGTVPGSWPDNHAFLGKPADPNTSLDLLGARQYDPVTGRFLSVDPAFELGDPLAMGGYAYADNNPVTYTDPTGLMPCIAGGPCGSFQALAQYSAAQQAAQYQSYQTVYNYYFVSQPAASQRVFLNGPTAPHAGVIVARFFIPQQVAIPPNLLLGDNRPFSTDPAASFRIALAWDTQTGAISYTVSASRTPGGWAPIEGPEHTHADVITKWQYFPPQVIPARQIGQPGGGNGISVRSANGGIVANYSGLNSFVWCCTVHGRVTMTMTSNSIYVNLNGNRYPNFEAIQYSPDRAPRFLAQSTMGPLNGINTFPGIQGFRNQTWANGNLISNTTSYPFEGWIP